MILQTLTLETRLQQSRLQFHHVVPFASQKDKLLPMNFSQSNTRLSASVLASTVLFNQYVQEELNANDATYGIGGYNEHRTIYTRSDVFNSSNNKTEPRRLHLGIDIWGTPGTPVFAPLGGVVHSFAFNNRFGDYGATLVLLHQLQGIAFHTLYGHLSIADLASLEEGKYISLGETIGHFGEMHENGNWPPHLHFQIIKDMDRNRGDYPGVCAYSEKEKYLANCPNPDLILNMMRFAHVAN